MLSKALDNEVGHRFVVHVSPVPICVCSVFESHEGDLDDAGELASELFLLALQ